MAEYAVSVDHEESNTAANNLSITGRVNGVQCATVIRVTTIEGKDGREQKRIKQLALIDAFRNKAQVAAERGGGDVIEVEED